ncbi:MAG: class I tRNA ligase family protein [Phycisphaerales bacterium]
MPTFYVTTPIYYVNDRPHIGHCYTTLLADVIARFHRLKGDDVLMLTGTDEHAEKVITRATEAGVTPQEWADRNAQAFREAFEFMGFSQDDFVRTSEDRHKTRASGYIQKLVDSGDIYLGDYEGWYDPGQEEYVTESVAKAHDYTSPVSGKPLEKRNEKNYFFRLSAFEERLRTYIEDHPRFVLPEARRNEVLGRLRQGLQDVPVSRAVRDADGADWGIRMPNDPDHRVYVWIEALCNYLTVVDTDDRRKYWPASIHLLAKDILWFHAVVWPAMLMALDEPLPGCVYAHAYCVAEGRKMSKSLGNFIEIDQLRAYGDRFSVDAVRWYLATQGPLGSTDADFAHSNFVEVYIAELTIGLGNCASRVVNMIHKYFDGELPEARDATVHAGVDWPSLTGGHVGRAEVCFSRADLHGAGHQGLAIVTAIDGYINTTEPFRLAKRIEGPDDPGRGDLALILFNCAAALRIAAMLLLPFMPSKAAAVLEMLGASAPGDGGLNEHAKWRGPQGLKPGTPVAKGPGLFMRAEADEPAPTA